MFRGAKFRTVVSLSLPFCSLSSASNPQRLSYPRAQSVMSRPKRASLRTSDRHRAVGCVLEAPDRPLMKACTSTASKPNTPRLATARRDGRQPTRRPAVLQVFRC
ncbi:hypothetical protein ABIE67_005002 [Streptomyces sp. V4I8]